ncbi:hypothetical protein A0H81_12688 [Grifola frondosa]|uniref:Uncharacterized protein n=1 Tax=Grifola frondosa TaxID=5627 RepID=A0A1C7LS33_GRIFR|nr:hypothetical protein A0H81_12688 [Grifola frondosa]
MAPHDDRFSRGYGSPVINLFIWIRSVTVQSDSGDCTTVFTPIIDIYDERESRAFMIACDTLVIVFTVKRTIDVQRIVSRVHTRIGIVSLTLLRDSTVYYLLLLLMNVAQIMISAWNGPALVAVLFTPITSILTSRMILDLRQANRTLGANFTSFFATSGSDDQVDVHEDGDLDDDPSHEAVDGAVIPLRELDRGVTAQDPPSLP